MIPVILKDLPIHWLKAEKITILLSQGKLDLVGLTCTHRPNIDGEKLKSLIPIPPENFTLLLYHTPDLAPIAANQGVDLQFSGHTHGGQVRIPGYGALVTGSSIRKAFRSRANCSWKHGIVCHSGYWARRRRGTSFASLLSARNHPLGNRWQRILKS